MSVDRRRARLHRGAGIRQQRHVRGDQPRHGRGHARDRWTTTRSRPATAAPARGRTPAPASTTALLDAGDMSDRLTATFDDARRASRRFPRRSPAATGTTRCVGGARDDLIDGGLGDDNLDGSVGDDTLRGGLGNDILQPNTGTDGISGGDGIDRVLYGDRTDPSYTLDGLANDGQADENDLIGADVEDIMSLAHVVGRQRDDRRRRPGEPPDRHERPGHHHRRRGQRRPRGRPPRRHDQRPRRLAGHRDLQRRHRHGRRRHARHDLDHVRERARSRPRPAARSTTGRR